MYETQKKSKDFVNLIDVSFRTNRNLINLLTAELYRKLSFRIIVLPKCIHDLLIGLLLLSFLLHRQCDRFKLKLRSEVPLQRDKHEF